MYDKLPEIKDGIVGGKSVIQISQELNIPVPSITQILPQILEQIKSEYGERSPFMDALNYTRLDLMINRVLEEALNPEVDRRLLDRLAKALAQLTKAQKEFQPVGESKHQKADKIINNNAIFISKEKSEETPQKLFLEKYQKMLTDGEDDD